MERCGNCLDTRHRGARTPSRKKARTTMKRVRWGAPKSGSHSCARDASSNALNALRVNGGCHGLGKSTMTGQRSGPRSSEGQRPARAPAPSPAQGCIPRQAAWLARLHHGICRSPPVCEAESLAPAIPGCSPLCHARLQVVRHLKAPWHLHAALAVVQQVPRGKIAVRTKPWNDGAARARHSDDG